VLARSIGQRAGTQKGDRHKKAAEEFEKFHHRFISPSPGWSLSASRLNPARAGRLLWAGESFGDALEVTEKGRPGPSLKFLRKSFA
jgi:hypothetical protein